MKLNSYRDNLKNKLRQRNVGEKIICEKRDLPNPKIMQHLDPQMVPIGIKAVFIYSRYNVLYCDFFVSINVITTSLIILSITNISVDH